MSARRDEERRAIEESAAEGRRFPRAIPSYLPDSPAPSLADECATCRSPILVHERTWVDSDTPWGFWARANLCGDLECEATWWECPPEVIADELKDRLRRVREGGA